MNNVSLIGRLTADPELKELTDKSKKYVRFTIAVDRGISKEDKEAGKQSADFINCIAWESTADILSKHVKKGHKVGLIGRIRTSSYEKEDGSKVYTTDIRVNRLELLESKPKEQRPESEYDGKETSTEAVEKDGVVEKDPFEQFAEDCVLTDEDLPF